MAFCLISIRGTKADLFYFCESLDWEFDLFNVSDRTAVTVNLEGCNFWLTCLRELQLRKCIGGSKPFPDSVLYQYSSVIKKDDKSLC